MCIRDSAYRDPRRDKAHGRIWRVAAKGAAIKPVDLLKAPLKTVVESLGSSEYWTRYQAKRAFSMHPRKEVAAELGRWVKGLDKSQPRYELRLYEALSAYATIEVVEPGLLGRVLRSQDHRGRAYAARLVGRWHDRRDSIATYRRSPATHDRSTPSAISDSDTGGRTDTHSAAIFGRINHTDA